MYKKNGMKYATGSSGAIPRPDAAMTILSGDLVGNIPEGTGSFVLLPRGPRLQHGMRLKQTTHPGPKGISHPPAPGSRDTVYGVGCAHLAGTFSRRLGASRSGFSLGSRDGGASRSGSTTILRFGLPMGAIAISSSLFSACSPLVKFIRPRPQSLR